MPSLAARKTSGQVPLPRCSRDIGEYTPSERRGNQSGLGEALVMGSRAARLAALIFLFAHFGGPSAGAMGLCDCCSGAALTPDCQSACGAAKEEIPMCRPVVIYDGDAGEPPGDNALAVGSLKHLSMGRPDRPALERFRQWFELWRSRAEEKFQAALARNESGEGSAAEFASAEAKHDQVLVNYQHGMRRYIEILRAGRHKRVMVLATAQSAKAAVPANVCRNWVNAPCVIADVKLAPAAPRLVPRVVAPRREVHRSKRAARQKIAQENRSAENRSAESRSAEIGPRCCQDRQGLHRKLGKRRLRCTIEHDDVRSTQPALRCGEPDPPGAARSAMRGHRASGATLRHITPPHRPSPRWNDPCRREVVRA